MLTHRLALIVVAVALLAPPRVYSQDAPRTGLVTGYPASIGLIVKASENVAVRSEFSYSGSNTDSEPPGSDNQSNRFAIGGSVLFYLRKIDDLRLYVSPRLSFSRSHSTAQYAGGQHSSSTLTA